jgi:site-specific recombinase XerD
MKLLAPHLTYFLQERLPRERDASRHTCEAYADALRLWVVFVAKRHRIAPSAIRVDHLESSIVLAFLDHLESERGNSARSRNARLAALKSFVRFLEYREPSCLEQTRRILAIPLKRTDERLVAHLSPDETRALLDAPDPSTREGIRDRAMLHVAFTAGLRVSELIGMLVDDVSLRPDPAIRVRGKGRRERLLPLWKETGTALRAWLAIRGPVSCPEVFTSARGQPLTRAGFEYILSKHVATASRFHASLKKKRVSPHVLRHTCAVHTLRATRDIRKVALWLGHANQQTTEIYLRVDPHDKLDAIESRLPPQLRRGRFRAPDKLLDLLRPKRS